MRSLGLGVLAVLAVATPSSAAPAAHWESRAPVPIARTEVSAAAANGRIVVAGGFLPDGSSSTRTDAYDPANDAWTRLPDLPLGVNHAAAASYRGRVYVLGGYAGGQRQRNAWVLQNGLWRTLPPLPYVRAAAAAAVAGGRLYLVGGVGAKGLARRTLVLDLARERWSAIPGPPPREHLAAASVGRRVYAIAGRLGGLNSNLGTMQSLRAGTRTWRQEPPVPQPRGGTGAAVVNGRIVSVGGEAPSGTIERVYRFDPNTRRWSRLADLPTPRHGLGVAEVGGRVYVVAGGPQPGLFVSAANEVLLP